MTVTDPNRPSRATTLTGEPVWHLIMRLRPQPVVCADPAPVDPAADRRRRSLISSGALW
jgi:hypothetical protein